jgi:uncharacterized protein (UPF0371 family)
VGDVVMEDPFCPGSTNYNRDVEAFPLVRSIMERLAPQHLLGNLVTSLLRFCSFF